MSKNKEKVLQFYIAYGLPGSGKTTELMALKFSVDANDKRRAKGPRTYLVDVDEITRNTYLSESRKMSHLREQLNARGYCEEVFFVDGLFTTNDDLVKILNLIKESNPEYELKVQVICFIEDREACIWNDESRRSLSCIESIKSLPYEKISENLIFEKTGVTINVVRKAVVRKPKYKKDAEELGLYVERGKYLNSSKWSMGGTLCTWTGSRSLISAETPRDFVEFDSLLEKIKPDLTFLQYKRIYRECVTVEEEYESDYYGGGVTYNFYRCDLEKLYDMIEE